MEDTEISCCIKGEKFLDLFNDCEILRKDRIQGGLVSGMQLSVLGNNVEFRI
jgi:hypothetical protein